jgi:hypothetical protein
MAHMPVAKVSSGHQQHHPFLRNPLTMPVRHAAQSVTQSRWPGQPARASLPGISLHVPLCQTPQCHGRCYCDATLVGLETMTPAALASHCSMNMSSADCRPCVFAVLSCRVQHGGHASCTHAALTLSQFGSLKTQAVVFTENYFGTLKPLSRLA